MEGALVTVKVAGLLVALPARLRTMLRYCEPLLLALTAVSVRVGDDAP